MHRRRLLMGGLGLAGLTACAPQIQGSALVAAGFSGPRIEPDALIASDGARLPMLVWRATGEGKAQIQPWAVVIGLHGMNDYAAAFGLAGPYWASHGVTTYAYDQRGFGRSAGRGVWAGEERMDEDLRTMTALARARYPAAVIAVVGESMGGAVGISAFASDRPPVADRLILASPAVWGWREQGAVNSATLWMGAHIAPASRVDAPNWLARRIRASDNVAELRRMGLDRNMVFATRIDTIYGLVGLMQHAQDQAGEVRAPLLYQYGAHDQIIPKHAAFHTVGRLRVGARTAYYRDGWHLLLRDLGRRRALDDVLSFIRDPAAPLPSDAPPIPALGVHRAV